MDQGGVRDQLAVLPQQGVHAAEGVLPVVVGQVGEDILEQVAAGIEHGGIQPAGVLDDELGHGRLIRSTCGRTVQEMDEHGTRPPITVRDDAGSRSYEALLDGKVVGTLIYEHEGPRLVLTHTIVEPDYRRRGIGTELARGALDDARAKGLSVTVFCDFVASFIDTHPDYADLVDAAHPGHAHRD